MTTARPVSPAAVKSMLLDGGELALIDLREELTFSQSHLLWARSVPLSRLELNFPRLVPRRATRTVLCDADDGLAERAATILARAGYGDLSYLQGGVAGWAAAGFELFSGVHVPSKAFGEYVEHDSGTPSVGPEELDALMRSGTDMVVLDSRPFDEYSRIAIPSGINVPGAELVLHVHDIAPSPDTLVVVNCAGRTRSIIGAQSLINAGVPNKVVALRNGTMGWHLAGLKVANGASRRFPTLSAQGLAASKARAAEVARRFGIPRIDRAGLERWQANKNRTLYIFDVREPSEYEAGHWPGALWAPGGQLVQETDTYAGTLGARIVLCDVHEVRAVMTASWLKQMGWKDVAVFTEPGDETGWPKPEILGTPSTQAIDVATLAQRLPSADIAVIDLSRSPNYRKGHIPGAWFAIRARLEHALSIIPPARDIVLTSEDGVLASLVVEETQALAKGNVRWLKGGNAAWSAAGQKLSAEPNMADEPLDAWLKPYERQGDPKDAMNAYLTWEIDLPERIARDGTCDFRPPPR